MKRNVQLDGLRGVFLIVMTNDHIGGTLSILTKEPLGFVGAAEGFVFLSALLAGVVYSRRAERHGQPALVRTALARSLTIYQYHLAVFLLILALCAAFSNVFYPWQSLASLFLDNPGEALAMGLVFLYQPKYMDILPMYCIFIALTPIALELLRRGKERTLLAASAGVWVAAQLGLNDALLALLERFLPVRLGLFNLFAWQALYLAGLWLGYKMHRGETPVIPYRRRYVTLGLVAFGAFLALRYSLRLAKVLYEAGAGALVPGDLLRPDSSFLQAVHALTDKGDLAVLRLVNFFVLAFVVSYLLERFRPLEKTTWLALLGRHSLQVYAFHVPVVYALFWLQWQLSPLPLAERSPYVMACNVLAIASLTLPALVHQRYKDRQALARA